MPVPNFLQTIAQLQQMKQMQQAPQPMDTFSEAAQGPDMSGMLSGPVPPPTIPDMEMPQYLSGQWANHGSALRMLRNPEEMKLAKELGISREDMMSALAARYQIMEMLPPVEQLKIAIQYAEKNGIDWKGYLEEARKKTEYPEMVPQWDKQY